MRDAFCVGRDVVFGRQQFQLQYNSSSTSKGGSTSRTYEGLCCPEPASNVILETEVFEPVLVSGFMPAPRFPCQVTRVIPALSCFSKVKQFCALQVLPGFSSRFPCQVTRVIPALSCFSKVKQFCALQVLPGFSSSPGL